MQPIGDDLQAMLQTPLYGLAPELQPLLQHVDEREHPWAPVEADHVHVDAHRALQRGRREQVRHQLLDVDASLLADDQPDRILMIRLIAKVIHLGELLRTHLRRDLLQHLAARYLVRQRRNDDVAVFDLKGGSQPQRAAPGRIDLLDIGSWRHQLAAGREIRALDVLHERRDGCLRRVQQVYERTGDFLEVVRRYIGRQTNRDTGRAIQQQVGEPCR